jgi:hypothetical protein
MSAAGGAAPRTDPPSAPPPESLRLLDLAALVVGYGLAALAVRALWPAGVTPRGAVLVVLTLAYTWLGLAMSGPFVLLRRPGPREDVPRDRAGRRMRPKVGRPLELRPEPPPRYTRAEAAWLIIGAYWIAAAILVVPTRLPARSAPILGLIPVLAALVLWVVGPRRPDPAPQRPTWTHQVAVGLLATWPVAWAALILLSATFG